jgi:hypothetical protein
MNDSIATFWCCPTCSSELNSQNGTYTLSFDISGNQRGSADDSMVVTLGGLLDNATGMVLAFKPIILRVAATVADCLCTTLSSCGAHLPTMFQISSQAAYRLCQRNK